MKIDKSLLRAIWRFVRGEVALMLALYFAYIAGRPELIALAPLFMAVSKYLRDKFDLDLKVI